MAKATCSEDGCEKPRKARGLCGTHYQRLARTEGKGRTLYAVTCDGCGKGFGSTRPGGKLCSDDCRTGPGAKMCALPSHHPVRTLIREADRDHMLLASQVHWSPLRRAYETGDHEGVIAQVRLRALQMPSGCWEWQRSSKDGYPVHNFGKRTVLVHRMVLESKHQASLGKQAAHHMCANTMCVNPDHLQPVTARENTAEMLARTYMESRITDLEAALAQHEPNHPLLREVGLVRVA